MQDTENKVLSKSDLIAKLQGISELYKEAEAMKAKATQFQPAENDSNQAPNEPTFPGEYHNDAERSLWEHAVLLHHIPNAAEEMEKYYREQCCPQYKAPVYQDPTPAAENNKLELFGKVCLGSGVVSLFLIGGALSVDGGFSIALVPILICVALFAGSLFKFCKKLKVVKENITIAKAEHEKVVAAAEAEHAKKMKQYEAEKEGFMKVYAQWREAYHSYEVEKMCKTTQWESDRKAGEQKLLSELYIPALKKLEAANDLVSEEYLPVLEDIIDLLCTNRADSLKEAINLYEEISDREKQYALQQKQYALQQEKKKQEEADARQQCRSCVHYNACNVKFRPNCASYIPER